MRYDVFSNSNFVAVPLLTRVTFKMWSYYLNAVWCYAYIEDVDYERSPSGVFQDQFQRSRWFTRVWTIQELIAPPMVVFYNSSWQFLGSRHDEQLLSLIQKVTHIPENILRSGGTGLRSRLKEYSIAQRFSWAASRSATRVEDLAYCLLGLFDINMPLIYGEGRKAFQRLQEEIIKTSTDHSIFAFDRSRSPGN